MGCLTCPGAVYVGNYEYDASERELERTFDKYGPVERVEYKSGMPDPLLPPRQRPARQGRAAGPAADVAA